MNKKQIYVYHIITSTDISELIQVTKPYPLVHFQHETCKLLCNKPGTIQSKSITADQPEQPRDDGEPRGDIPEGELGEISQPSCTELCPGPDGVIESKDESGYRIRWRNGHCRRYSYGGGSRDRYEEGDDSMGKELSIVGSYSTINEGQIEKLYEGPYKLIAYHYGTRRPHWHLIYYSYNKQWGSNSRLGRTIRAGTYKNKSVDCLSCVREYLYSGNGRQVLQDVLRKEHLETCRCAEHNCGMVGENQWKRQTYQNDCSEGGDSIFRSESLSYQKRDHRMVDAINETDDGETGEPRHKIPNQNGQVLDGRKANSNDYDNRENKYVCGRNTDIIILLCTRGAFTEAEAMGVFTQSNQGIDLMCTKIYNEKIKNWVHIARVLVFQESVKQRFERAKKKFEEDNECLMSNEIQEEHKLMLKEILNMNKIDIKEFFINTYKHFMSQNQKKNNLFFLGPPSTGKTMIMNSLVECHFNYCRLTGLISNSSFNFSGLLHTNACLMDECKLTDNQFEQWKLLASGLPMSTDVKYKDRCDVKNVVLYTCSNYPIEMYCNAPMAREAVATRTVKYELKVQCPWFFKLSPHVWEKCWAEFDLII